MTEPTGALRDDLLVDPVVAHMTKLGALGRYELRGVLGAGGMGVVFAAYDPELHREVALKVLRPGAYGTRGPLGFERLLGEARAIARLSHPNVVTVYDTGVHRDQVFLVMERVSGRSLRAYLDEPYDAREATALLLQAARGLEAAHRAGLVHRDFKPENVLVGDDGRVRVVDFGLAHHASVDDDADEYGSDEPDGFAGSREGGVAGTPGYIAPECFLAAPLDPRSDQWAFCVVLHEAVCGARPSADRVRERPSSKPIRAILERGLARDPRDRFESMTALAEALEAALRDESPWGDPRATVPPPRRALAATLDDYLDGLPEGLASFPRYRMLAALPKLALSRHPLGAIDPRILPAVDSLRGSAEHLPEVAGRAILLCVAAEARANGVEDRDLVRGLVRAVVAGRFLGFALPPLRSPSFYEALLRAYAGLHEGLAIVCDSTGPTGAELRLEAPAGLVDTLTLLEAEAFVSSLLEAAGAKGIEVHSNPAAHAFTVRFR
jgi:serine/threonine protein kinase